MPTEVYPAPIQGQGEYGATTVEVTRNGDAVRVAFGRHNGIGQKLFLGAVLLTGEAFAELQSEIAKLPK